MSLLKILIYLELITICNFLSVDLITFILRIKLNTIVPRDIIVKVEVRYVKMENKIGEFPPEYEQMLDKLTAQINNLFSEIYYYQALITEKDNMITRLSTENSILKMKLQNVSQRLETPSLPSQQSYTPPSLKRSNTPMRTTSVSGGTMKRICPECGAMGFAIKEVDDKSRVISYVPRRIYHKKMVCTKCRFEFN